MLKIDTGSNLPIGVRQQLTGRMKDRAIDINDLNQVRLGVDWALEVPGGDCTGILERSLCGSGSSDISA